MKSQLPLFFCLPLLLFTVGCGGYTTYPVTGKVTFPNGEPLPNAKISFDPVEEGQPGARGTTDSNGVYTLKTGEQEGVVAGKSRVLVIASQPTPEGYDETQGGSLPETKPVIHRKFNAYKTSGLEYEVKTSGDNEYNITVEKP